jgi:hypothetical protein
VFTAVYARTPGSWLERQVGARTTAPCARLYQITDNGKIKTEQVVFYLAQD